MKSILFLLSLLIISISSSSQVLKIAPYLEHAEPNHIHISWVTDSNTETVVEWGTSESLGMSTTGNSFSNLFSDIIHETELTGLSPATKYFYRVITGGISSSVYEFVTPPLASAEQSFNLVAMSDMQRDGGNPTIFEEIINDGVIPIIEENYGPDISSNLGFALIPGDLVDNGLNYSSWENEFFDPAADLFSQIPVYPVLGNHENNTPYYFDFFHLPENGSTGSEEHWWYKDYSNVRIIGLNSNPPFNTAEQLAWLQTILNQTCANSDIDFVFAQLHHPHHSELWLPGESGFSTSVVEILENFSTNCGKPSIHFFGHTHGYSRGQSKDHDHLMVNVATAGGNIDYWGEFAQFDYPEFTVSHDDWGFVILEVDAGENPKFKLLRYSRGNEFMPLQNMLRDSIEIKKNNLPPTQPTGVSPNNEVVDPNCLLLVGSPYNDSDNDIHMASEWQISTNAMDFSTPIYEAFRTHENWYFNVDTQAEEILVDEKVIGMPENTTLHWRVRYRDHSLGWSSWSIPILFQTGVSNESTNLIQNIGAENGINNWTVNQGVLESLTAGECAGTSPHSGTYYFGIGGLCVESAYGEASQVIDLSSFTTEINSGTQFAHFGAYMSDYSGDDIPEIHIELLDNSQNVLSSSSPISGNQTSWTLFEETTPIPIGTVQARFIMTGTRNGGVDNDSYVDDIFFKVSGGTCDDSVFDEDNDGIIDSIDNCLGLMNSNQADFNENGVGDACEDSDGDGILDSDEINIYQTNPMEADSDFDGLNDFEEIFTTTTNPLLQDTDGDGLTDHLEVNQSLTDPNLIDSDGDGCPDDLEYNLACPDSVCGNCPTDLNNSGTVDAGDLLIFLASFGEVCPE